MASDSTTTIPSSQRAGASRVRSSTVRRSQTRWTIAGGGEESILGEGTPDWFGLGDGGRAECVKKGHLRSVWRVGVGDRTVYAKVFERPGLIRRVLAMLGWSDAEREFRTCRRAEGQGVPVIRALGVGVRDRGARSVLLTEGLDGACELSEVWEEFSGSGGSGVDRRRRLKLIETTAQFLSHCHERGFFHRDGHPGNMLVVRRREGGIELRFADVNGARVYRGTLPRRARLVSLAQLDQYFQRVAQRTDRLRFLRSYLCGEESGARGLESVGRTFLSALDSAKSRHSERLVRRRDRRLRRDGKYFTTLSLGGGWKATVVLTLSRRRCFSEPIHVDRAVGAWRAILEPVVSWSKSAPGVEFPVDDGRLIVELRHRDVSASWPGAVGHRVRFERCHQLRHRDVKTELILACAWHRRWGRVDRSMLLRPARADGEGVEAIKCFEGMDHVGD